MQQIKRRNHRRIWLLSLLTAGSMVTGSTMLLTWWLSIETSPVPTSVTSSIPDTRWNQLTMELENSARKYHGDIGILMQDLRTNRQWSYKADRLFPSASLIKIPIMAATFEKIKSGELSLDTTLALAHKDRMSGSGRLKWQQAGVSFTIKELLYYMITESDNTAMRVLVNHLGLEFIQAKFRNFGLLTTNIEETGLKLSSRPVLRENYTTAREMGELLERVYRGTLVDQQSSQVMLDILQSLKHKERLARTLPPGWQIAHKTGLLRRACHDAGIIFSPEGDYILVVLTWKGPDYRTSKRYISQIGKITYRYFSRESDLATTTPKSSIRGI